METQLDARTLTNRGISRRAFTCAAGALAGSVALSGALGRNRSALADEAAAPVEQTYTPGTYTGSFEGNGGDVVVDVTFSEHAIDAIEVTSQSETPIVAEGALEQLPQLIIEKQSLGIDTMTGATITSAAILNAVAAAAEQAGADLDALWTSVDEEPSTEVVEMTADAVVVGARRCGHGRHHPPAGARPARRARREDVPHGRLHLRLGRQPGRHLQRPAGRGRRLRRLPRVDDRGLPGQRRGHVRARAHRALLQERGRDHQLAQRPTAASRTTWKAACTTWPSTATTASSPTTAAARVPAAPLRVALRRLGRRRPARHLDPGHRHVRGRRQRYPGHRQGRHHLQHQRPGRDPRHRRLRREQHLAARVARRLALLRPHHLYRRRPDRRDRRGRERRRPSCSSTPSSTPTASRSRPAVPSRPSTATCSCGR